MYFISILISVLISLSSLFSSFSFESFKFETQPSEMCIYNTEKNEGYSPYKDNHIAYFKEADSNLMAPYYY